MIEATEPKKLLIANVIHWKERKDRYDLIIKESNEQGFEIRWWDAIIAHPPKTGICQAHKNVVRWAKEQGMPNCLVIEDDAKFTAPGALFWFTRHLPDDYDIYLAGTCWRKPLPADGIMRMFCWMHCYYIHSRFYDKFLAVRENTDIENALAGLGKYVVCQPFAAIQHETYSDNAKRVRPHDCLIGKPLYDGTQE